MQRCFRRGLPARLLLLAEFAIEARKGDLTLSLELEPSFAKELEPSFAVSTTVFRYSFVCSFNKHLFLHACRAIFQPFSVACDRACRS